MMPDGLDFSFSNQTCWLAEACNSVLVCMQGAALLLEQQPRAASGYRGSRHDAQQSRLFFSCVQG